MSWLRLDDRHDEHPKIEPLSNAGFRLHIKILLYCARNCTNGVVTGAKLTQLASTIPGRYGVANLVRELVNAKLLDETSNGVTVHDYLDYNPSKEQVLESRKRSAQRQKRYRNKKRESGSQPESDAVTNGVTPRVSNAVSHTGPSHPIPGMEDEDAPAAGASGSGTNGSPPPEGCGQCVAFGSNVGFNQAAGKPCDCRLGLWRLREKQRTGRWPVGPDRPGDAPPPTKRRRRDSKLTPEEHEELETLIDKVLAEDEEQKLDPEVPL
jgi:hypothetical protein